MKLCKDCKFCHNNLWCKHPANGKSLVDGEPKTAFAAINRNSQDKCGEEGHWFHNAEQKATLLQKLGFVR